MARFGIRLAAWALGSLLLTACLGGQTGQPGSLDCAGVGSDSDAAKAFVGNYAAGLSWQEEPLDTASPTVVTLDDTVQLTIGSDSAPVVAECGDLRIPVTVVLTTTTSGISESGDAEIVLSGPTKPLRGRLVFQGTRVHLNVTLLEHSAGMTPEGALEALDSDLPGAAATLVEP